MPKTLLQSIQKEDKVFVECRAGNCAKVTLCYRITSMNRESSEYKSELLNHLYYGIFNKEFILFYGEVLQYYFIIEEKGLVDENPKYSDISLSDLLVIDNRFLAQLILF